MVTHHGNCGLLFTAITATVAALMLSGCGNDGSTVPQASTAANQTDSTTKQSKALPDEQHLEGPTSNDTPATTDHEVVHELRTRKEITFTFD